MKTILMALLIVTMPLSVGAEQSTESLIQQAKILLDLHCSLEPQDCRNIPCCEFYPEDKNCEDCNATVEQPKDAKPDFPCCNIPKEFSNLNLKDCQLCPKDQAVEDDNKWQEDCDFWLDAMKQTKNDKDFLFYANVSTAFCTRALLEEMDK